MNRISGLIATNKSIKGNSTTAVDIMKIEVKVRISKNVFYQNVKVLTIENILKAFSRSWSENQLGKWFNQFNSWKYSIET